MVLRSLAGTLADLAERVDRRLPALLPSAEQRPEPVHRAMLYALTGAGKRVRPVLTLAVAESAALLAALPLLNRAYSLVAESAPPLPPKRYTSEDMVHPLAAAIGSEGLIGGQALDLLTPPGDLDLELLEYIHSHKTGALFMAAGELGAMAADARRRDLELVARFAKNLGLAFQISDDLLDLLRTPETSGKDVHQAHGQVTFVNLLG